MTNYHVFYGDSILLLMFYLLFGCPFCLLLCFMVSLFRYSDNCLLVIYSYFKAIVSWARFFQEVYIGRSYQSFCILSIIIRQRWWFCTQGVPVRDLRSAGQLSTSLDISVSSYSSSEHRAQSLNYLPVQFMGDRLLSSHSQFQTRSALLPIFVGKVKGPFSTSITINSLITDFLYQLFTQPLVFNLYHLQSQEI